MSSAAATVEAPNVSARPPPRRSGFVPVLAQFPNQYVPSQNQTDWSAVAVTTTSRLNWVSRPVPALKTQIALTSLLQVQAPSVLPFLISMLACTTFSAWLR